MITQLKEFDWTSCIIRLLQTNSKTPNKGIPISDPSFYRNWWVSWFIWLTLDQILHMMCNI